MTGTVSGDDIRPFRIDVAEEQLDDLRRRITATKWPDRETDPSQGVRLETIQALADYWAMRYDWRAFEARFRGSRPFRISSPRSTAWTSTSSKCGPSTTTRCR
jgi:hypothetical protein